VEGGSTGGERNFQLSRRKDIQGRLAPGSTGQPVVIADFLKGPKLEIFTQIRPSWTGDLETRPKNIIVYGWGLICTFYRRFFRAVSDIA
jgi:hypothetical protein